VLHELRAAMAFHNSGGQLHFWRTSHGTEVDFIWTRANRSVGIEVKTAERWRPEFGVALKGLIEEGVVQAGFGVYAGPSNSAMVPCVSCRCSSSSGPSWKRGFSTRPHCPVVRQAGPLRGWDFPVKGASGIPPGEGTRPSDGHAGGDFGGRDRAVEGGALAWGAAYGSDGLLEFGRRAVFAVGAATATGDAFLV
jgi:Domain of unknown function (DUF4143)